MMKIITTILRVKQKINQYEKRPKTNIGMNSTKVEKRSDWVKEQQISNQIEFV